MRHRSQPLISDISIIVYLSIILVLLFTFMIYAEPHSRNVAVDLAQVQHPTTMYGANREDAVIVFVMRDGKFYIGKDRCDKSSLPSAIRERLDHSREKKVYVKADARARYRAVLEVIEALQVEKIGHVFFLVDELQPSRSTM